jgi:hypothetical protein
VHRLLGEQEQDGRANVAACTPTPVPTAPEGAAPAAITAVTARSGAEATRITGTTGTTGTEACARSGRAEVGARTGRSEATTPVAASGAASGRTVTITVSALGRTGARAHAGVEEVLTLTWASVAPASPPAGPVGATTRSEVVVEVESECHVNLLGLTRT